jgi:hypothetical protein
MLSLQSSKIGEKGKTWSHFVLVGSHFGSPVKDKWLVGVAHVTLHRNTAKWILLGNLM